MFKKKHLSFTIPNTKWFLFIINFSYFIYFSKFSLTDSDVVQSTNSPDWPPKPVDARQDYVSSASSSSHKQSLCTWSHTIHPAVSKLQDDSF